MAKGSVLRLCHSHSAPRKASNVWSRLATFFTCHLGFVLSNHMIQPYITHANNHNRLGDGCAKTKQGAPPHVPPQLACQSSLPEPWRRPPPAAHTVAGHSSLSGGQPPPFTGHQSTTQVVQSCNCGLWHTQHNTWHTWHHTHTHTHDKCVCTFQLTMTTHWRLSCPMCRPHMSNDPAYLCLHTLCMSGVMLYACHVCVMISHLFQNK